MFINHQQTACEGHFKGHKNITQKKREQQHRMIIELILQKELMTS
jgi:hypothetical protein